MYKEIAWQEFDRNDRIVTKRKAFKNASAAERFIDKLTEKANFYRITATRQDEEYTEWEKKRLAEQEEIRVFRRHENIPLAIAELDLERRFAVLQESMDPIANAQALGPEKYLSHVCPSFGGWRYASHVFP